MTFPKALVIVFTIIFGVIGLASLFRSGGEPSAQSGQSITFSNESPAQAPGPEYVKSPVEAINRMGEFFNTHEPKFPVVETVTYSRKVPWLDGKFAWVVDYANHYKTSRHFIARSLNNAPNYDDQRVANGDRFNVFKLDRPISFHLVVDHAQSRMWVYYLDGTTNVRTLVASYPVGLGRPDPARTSKSLTPLGTYALGDKITVYRKGTMGTYEGERIEMIQTFGTRWIPLGAEVADCSAPPRGLGLHGCPWMSSGSGGEWGEDLSGIGQNTSDGCIRLKTEDMEELFAVVITRPTTLYLVSHFNEAQLPGEER